MKNGQLNAGVLGAQLNQSNAHSAKSLFNNPSNNAQILSPNHSNKSLEDMEKIFANNFKISQQNNSNINHVIFKSDYQGQNNLQSYSGMQNPNQQNYYRNNTFSYNNSQYINNFGVTNNSSNHNNNNQEGKITSIPMNNVRTFSGNPNSGPINLYYNSLGGGIGAIGNSMQQLIGQSGQHTQIGSSSSNQNQRNYNNYMNFGSTIQNQINPVSNSHSQNIHFNNIQIHGQVTKPKRKNLTDVNKETYQNIYPQILSQNFSNSNQNEGPNSQNNLKKKGNNNNNNVINTENSSILKKKVQDDSNSLNNFLKGINEELIDYVRTQKGSRNLQKFLINISNENLNLIFSRLNDRITDLMVDVYGNYLCQKIVTCCSVEQRIYLFNAVSLSFFNITYHIDFQRFLLHSVSQLRYSCFAISNCSCEQQCRKRDY